VTGGRRNALLAGGLAVVISGMLGLTAAAVPLYRMFCAATGYGGTPQIGPARSAGAVERTITVRFNADTNPGLPWDFKPEQKSVTLKLGEEQVAFYQARNEASLPVTGIALYSRRLRRANRCSFPSVSGSIRRSPPTPARAMSRRSRCRTRSSIRSTMPPAAARSPAPGRMSAR
jgi:hypothetical protein